MREEHVHAAIHAFPVAAGSTADEEQGAITLREAVCLAVAPANQRL